MSAGKPCINSLDGNPGPLTCISGGLNVLAWNAFSSEGTNVMSLGRSASPKQAEHAMCVDMAVDHATGPEEISAATLAGLYYGWVFVGQLERFQASRCPNLLPYYGAP